MSEPFAPRSEDGPDPPRRRHHPHRQLWIPIAIAVCAFAIDIKTKSGLIDGSLYVLAVLACIWVPEKRSAPYVAAGVMIPLIAGFFLSPSGATTWTSMTNRFISVMAICLAAWVIRRHACLAGNKDQRIANLQRRLSDAESITVEDREKLLAWLIQDLHRDLQRIDWQLNHVLHGVRRSSDLRTESLALRQMVERVCCKVRKKANQLCEAPLEEGAIPTQSANRCARSGHKCGLMTDNQQPFGGY